MVVLKMQNSFPYLDILIFGIIAVFLVFRLKNILGTKTDLQENSLKKKEKSKSSNIVTLKPKSFDKNYNSTSSELKKILNADSNFDEEDFLSGSRTFFKMVLDGFVKGDLNNVKDFIKPTVLKSFNNVIKERNKEKEILTIDLKAIEKNEILSSQISKVSLKINVVFETLQIKGLKDKNDELIDGDLSKEILVKDVWVFEKKLDSINPNWTLIETKSF